MGGQQRPIFRLAQMSPGERLAPCLNVAALIIRGAGVLCRKILSPIGKGHAHVPNIPEQDVLSLLIANQIQRHQIHTGLPVIGVPAVQHQPLAVKAAIFIRLTEADHISRLDFSFRRLCG